jgi:AraC family transcriptional activator of pobA
MNVTIPLLPLDSLPETIEGSAAVRFTGPTTAPLRHLPLDKPNRNTFYNIGLCVRGSARLRVNLETYELGPASLIVLSPHTIMQWVARSADCEALSLFFTNEFAAAGGGASPEGFAFFAPDAQHVVSLSPEAAARLTAQLHTIGQRYASPHPYREPILRSLLQVLLYDTAPLYTAQHVASTTGRSRSQVIAAAFKQLVTTHYATQRNLAFYADQLCITPPYLAETVQAATGKRAVQWVTDAVLLEARVLLHNPTLSLAQIAEVLHFADQSTFGRFFRHQTGLTPARYRQQL